MKWFKTNWFSSKEREELLKRQDELENKVNLLLSEKKSETFSKPYRNLIFTGDTLTVTTNTGDVITKSGVSIETVNKVRTAATEEQVIAILNYNTHVEKTDDIKEIVKYTNVLETHPDFEFINGLLYFKGVKLHLPPIVLSSFIEIVEKIKGGIDYSAQYEALKMFWFKLALNPIEQSREDLLNFVKLNDVKITKNGNLILYRRIVTISKKNTGLVKFVSNTYYKVKGTWKKSPKNYFVFERDGKYFFSNKKQVQLKSKLVGNLDELYKNPNTNEENLYTSYHNKNKHQIRVGQIYQISDSEINLNNGICAAGGLHAANVNYNYSGFGDTPVVVLVSPSKAITVPTGDAGKLRTTEMFIACVNTNPHCVHFAEDQLDIFDEEYNRFSINELEDAIKAKSFKVASVQKQVSPISFKDLETIKNLLKQRIVKV